MSAMSHGSLSSTGFEFSLVLFFALYLTSPFYALLSSLETSMGTSLPGDNEIMQMKNSQV